VILLKNTFVPHAKGPHGEGPHGEGWKKKDVAVANGVYQMVADLISESTLGECEIVDASGCYLLPSFIDPHVHVREPGFTHKEDWETCSRAALKGGTGVIFDMPNNKVPVTGYDSLHMKRELAMRKSYVNFGLYCALTDDNVDDLKTPKVQGAMAAVKVYLAETTGHILVRSERSLLEVFNQPKPVMVHSGGAEGLEKILSFYDKASHQFSGVPFLSLCHISTAEELTILRKWKKRYGSIFAEVTPHHLFLNREEYSGPVGVLPPLSTKKDIASLWDGVLEGIIDFVGTDHAPHTVEEKKSPHPPSGFPGLETAFSLLFSAWKNGDISLANLIGLTSKNVKTVFNMGKYGEIREGTQANCVLFEQQEFTVGEDGYETKSGWSPFHGWKLQFKPIVTIVNGLIAYREDRFRRVPVCMIEG
jgi:dihydroorotase